ncbi:MAG: helix-turn-helix domain-containing protein [Deltaproteobacteria bacterium]|nr:helix-turn-helix domain-containing protein [Deltaproteobacteria bacterium]
MARETQRPLLLVGLKDISKALGCSPAEAGTLVRAGELPAARVGRSWAVPWASLERWAEAIAAGKQGPDAESGGGPAGRSGHGKESHRPGALGAGDRSRREAGRSGPREPGGNR